MTLQAQVTLKMDSTIPADAAMNTYHFEPASGVEPINAVIGNYSGAVGGISVGIDEALQDLYNGFRQVLSTTINPATTRLKVYDLDDPTPRVPIYDELMPISSTGTTAMPAEVALVSSFQAAELSGVSQASRRNRVFIGPLINSISGTDGRPTALPLDDIEGAFAALAQEAENQAAGWSWVVYSPKLGTSAPVANGWVDNAFDSQRRRGVEATARQAWIA